MTLHKNLNPLPLNTNDEESPTTDSNDAAEESSTAPSSDCKLEESPTTTDSDPDEPKAESPMTKSNEAEEQESPSTLHQMTTRGVTNELMAKMKNLAKEAKPQSDIRN